MPPLRFRLGSGSQGSQLDSGLSAKVTEVSDASSSSKVEESGCKGSQSSDALIKAAEALDQTTSMRVPDGGTGEFESLLSNSFGEPGVSAHAKGLPSPQAVFSMEESRVKTFSGVPVYQGEKPLDIPELPGLPYNPVRGSKEESGVRTSSNASGFKEESGVRTSSNASGFDEKSGFRTSSGVLESNEEPSVGTSSKIPGIRALSRRAPKG